MIYELGDWQKMIANYRRYKTVKKGSKNYVNLPIAFDIETTSFYSRTDTIISNKEQSEKLYKDAKKCATMYVWQVAIADDVIIGRSWNDLYFLLDCLHGAFNLETNYLIIYVHNLAYEFQFMSKRFSWKKVFADDERKPIYAETDAHIVFKCSYRLSGYSLATVAKNLQSKKVEKLTGYLNYDELRHCQTELTNEELQYCANDVLIVTAYIAEQIKQWKNIVKIPLTQTGAVRRLVRDNCFKSKKYKWLVRRLKIEPSEYRFMRSAFQGGFTHANALYVNSVVRNVASFDFTSSYPSVMIAEKYPMSKGIVFKIKSEKQIAEMSDTYCMLMDVTFYDVSASFRYESIVSLSKCTDVANALINNGRIASAKRFRTVLTELDYLNMRKFYKWNKSKIHKCYIYKKEYLPKPIVQTILDLYGKKTTLKNVVGKEQEYLHSKELLNSIYGMCVTNIIRDTYTYKNDEWQTKQSDLNKEIKKYNSDKTRFLFYLWGVYVTAYARNNLYSAILECGRDYIYSDTDSVKIRNANAHKKYFDDYNRRVTEKINVALDYHHIDKALAVPKTVSGIDKPMGLWDAEGIYKKFKTLGAKRYMYDDGKHINITVAGLAKQIGRDYIVSKKNAFAFFNDMMTIDREHSGRLIHTYIDSGCKGAFADCNGKIGSFSELSYIHLEPSEYNLSITKQFIDYFTKMQERNYNE